MTRSIARAATAAALLAIVVWLGSARVAAAGETACTPGVVHVHGVPVRVFCGPARARVRYRGKTYKFSRGSCARGTGKFAGGFGLNLGELALRGRAPSSLSYFGLLVEGTHPGTYKGTKVLVEFQVGGRRVGLHDLFGEARPDTTVVLRRGSGTFSGKDTHGFRATGSFTC
jgi:hypothetical protein